MSIYGRRKGVMDFEKMESALPARPARARGASSSPPAVSEPPDDEIAWLRKAKPADRLLPLADRWFDRLPSTARPCALVTYFPRIVNVLALRWHDRQACPAYFEDLLVDRRGGRRGFPPAVLRDLHTLRDYWFSGTGR